MEKVARNTRSCQKMWPSNLWNALVMLEFLKYIEGVLLFWERRHRGGGGEGEGGTLGIFGEDVPLGPWNP